MRVFAKTRKRQLVEILHENGISIFYDRVLKISAQLGEAVVAQNVEDGVICPPALKKHVFTTSAMDNITTTRLQLQLALLSMAPVCPSFSTQAVAARKTVPGGANVSAQGFLVPLCAAVFVTSNVAANQDLYMNIGQQILNILCIIILALM